jgi:hypothetical protein
MDPDMQEICSGRSPPAAWTLHNRGQIDPDTFAA